MEIELPQEPSRAEEMTFAHDFSSDDKEEDVQWEQGDTPLALQAEEAAMKGARNSLLQVHDIPEDEMSLNRLFSPLKEKLQIVRES